MSDANRTNRPRRDRVPRGETRPSRALQAEEELRQAALEPELPVDDESRVEADPDAEEILNDTQTLAPDPPLDDPDRRRDIILAGGDVDATGDATQVGEEAVGGTTPMPDQDVVDDLGRAAGVTYADTEPLRPEEKEAQRDAERWELDPASAEDYEQRTRAMDRPKRRPRPRA
jgi:hypothetical protein